jgi:outer membrane protein, heavy metal efflux system
MTAISLHRRAPAGRACGGVVWFLALGTLAGCGTSGTASYAGSTTPTSEAGARSASLPSERGKAATHDLQGPVLERASFVRAVLRNNPSVESARQGFRAALGRVRQAGAFEDPMLDLGLAPLSVAREGVPLGYEVQLSQRLPWFGKRALETQMASAEAGAAEADYQSVRRELGMTAVLLYDQYYVATRSLDINAEHVVLMRAMQAGVTAQFEAGRASAQDPLQAEVELSHMEHDVVKLASQRDVTVAQMNELLHRAPELPLPPPPKELPPALPVDATSVARLEAQAVSASSEIQAAKEHVRAEQARADRASRDAYPDFTVSASYNSMWEMPEHRFMVGLGFNLPLQAGRRGGAADAALAARAQFESEISRLTDAARTRVFVTAKQLEESAHVLHLFETRLLPVARQQVDAARAGFVASRNSFFAVVDAEKNLRSAELDHQLALAEYHRRRAELDSALGRIPGLDWKDGDR